MIWRGISIIRQFGKKKADSDSLPLHPPTVERWSTGEGEIPNRPISVWSWNVNGIRSVIKKNDLQNLITQNKPDILCLSQTKIDLKSYEKVQPSLQMQGYQSYFNFCKVSSGYSGTMIYSKYKPKRILEDIGVPQHDLEGRVLTLEFDKFYIVNCYTPNSGLGLVRLNYRVQSYDVSFRNYIKGLLKEKVVILAGDLNVAHQKIDVAKYQYAHKLPGFTPEERNSFQQLLDEGLTDSFRRLHPEKKQYTWWSNIFEARRHNIGWRIDYVLTDNRISLLQSKIHKDIFGSDHCPISAIVSFDA